MIVTIICFDGFDILFTAIDVFDIEICTTLQFDKKREEKKKMFREVLAH